MTDAERNVIKAAIELYQMNGGQPAILASKKLDEAVEALLKERGWRS